MSSPFVLQKREKILQKAEVVVAAELRADDALMVEESGDA